MQANERQQGTWSPDETPRNSRLYTDIELNGDEKHDSRSQPSTSASDSHSDNNPHHGHQYDDGQPFPWRRHKLTIRQRLQHFTWAWYTLSMSTGGISLLIFALPFQFTGLSVIGWIFYIANLIIFTCITTAMLMRFMFHKGTFSASLKHEREGFFFPTFWLSVATLITSTQRYVIQPHDSNLLWAIQTVFWGYAICTFALAVGQYCFVFSAHNFGLGTMMPTWILPIFPIMLTGTIASVIAETQPEIGRIPILVAGLTCQGLGLSVAFMMYAHMVGRLMSVGLPNREHRPGLFMCVGPPAFTVLALIGMAHSLPDNLALEVDDNFLDVKDVRTTALIVGGFLWALSLWWFFIAAISVILSPPKFFHLGWWAMVFPNTGFCLATISVAKQFDNQGLKILGTVMSAIVFVLYFVVIQSQVKAVWRQDILYPGRDEDFNDH
ncbi:hypothetical protein TWF106_009499 [Orbilia oligospora]|uniref:C4-dicarboxylate transporter/malic acid transport protein n=1 Tax=Orbilia oligospora TaxID=2813651 RepID=A0A6G1MJ32_ORBOL|nr:hypothetical protein TWF788_001250 [Orbilia oligospora]KAF3202643.1 hypothetical protein TWF679_010737 [Orbilia oligospora]KAF3213372.1 hypothetical protein TWF106_009499 [Orbilia oligospora]KAF3260629.1 hypothetical protein TWF192_009910 [Orbilia oligospora]